jgi:hypothetical protein
MRTANTPRHAISPNRCRFLTCLDGAYLVNNSRRNEASLFNRIWGNKWLEATRFLSLRSDSYYSRAIEVTDQRDYAVYERIEKTLVPREIQRRSAHLPLVFDDSQIRVRLARRVGKAGNQQWTAP